MDRVGALEGVTVLDLTRVLAGPFASMMMADMGANVIKIEETGKGADERQMGPFLNGESAYYMNLNRNKKGITSSTPRPGRSSWRWSRSPTSSSRTSAPRR